MTPETVGHYTIENELGQGQNGTVYLARDMRLDRPVALKVLERSHVYGALWMVPVILIWFYLCWTVILFGAELAFYLQKGGDPRKLG